MRNKTELTEAGKQYTEAYAVHYTTKDLHKAIDLYKGIMATHPNAKEAEYSRTQIHNIAKSVVPKEDLLAAHLALTLACLVRDAPSDVQPVPLTPLASQLPG